MFNFRKVFYIYQMKLFLFLLGLLFFGLGYFFFTLDLDPEPVEELPNYRQKQGIISSINTYRSSKFGEVFYFKLDNSDRNFWLKARMEKVEGLKEKLLKDVRKGDTVTVFYTTLDGTQYEYASAPENVHKIVKAGHTIEGLTFVGNQEPDTFMSTLFKTLGMIMLLVGSLLLLAGVRLLFSKR